MQPKYKILDKSYLEKYPEASVVIQYVLNETGNSYEIGINTSQIKTEQDVEK